MMEFNIGKIIVNEEIKIADIELDVLKIYPELEDLEITPTAQEQNFISENGYRNVKVKAIETEELSLVPSQNEQVQEGVFNKVTLLGDVNLLPENIKKDVEIFGVTGTAEVVDFKIDDASYLFNRGARLNLLEPLLSLCKNITTTAYMFNNCTSLITLDLANLDTSNVTNMSYMFSVCSSLETLKVTNLNTSNVANMTNMFANCKTLTTLDLNSFDMSNVINVSSMFSNCSGLINFVCFKYLGKAYRVKTKNYSNYKLDLSRCTKLSNESLMSVINNLYDLNLTYDVANGGTLYTQALVLGSTNLAKLTTEEIAIATDKGWTVS